MPHDGKAVAWHQDASYWPLSPSKTVTVWLAIDDADVDNAVDQDAGETGTNDLFDNESDDDEAPGAPVAPETSAMASSSGWRVLRSISSRMASTRAPLSGCR